MEQPSPALMLPSSHASSPVTLRSPQTIVETHGLPGVGHAKNGSNLQTPVQPSPGLVLPSSQSSPAVTLLSPQNGISEQATPAVGHIQPFSIVHVAEQP